MSELAIRAEGLSKRYRVGRREASYGTLRDTLTDVARAPLRYLRGRRRRGVPGADGDRTFWALKDASFEINQGEVVGLIGRNGAGKTTLLKVLSRITEPTEGYAEIRGRVGSLLEVGTGFHPELTGRENVYLNGAIIGMRKREIDRKFDEIVAFAEIDRFLDTPVKYYSSGMYVRLAFAVAAHFAPDIMLVDEVLAVGDIQFQKKCLGKMDEVARGGRTVLFISHQLTQIRRLCQRVFWLDGGRIRASGETGRIVALYESGEEAAADPGSAGRGCFVRWELVGGGHTLRESDPPVTFSVAAHLDRPVVGGHFGFVITNDFGMVVAGWAFENLSLEPGPREFVVEVPSLPLRPGTYVLMCSLFDRGNNLTGGDLIEVWHGVPRLSIEAPPAGHPQDEWAGFLNIPAKLVTRRAVDDAA